jgi:hypothetical protein
MPGCSKKLRSRWQILKKRGHLYPLTIEAVEIGRVIVESNKYPNFISVPEANWG